MFFDLPRGTVALSVSLGLALASCGGDDALSKGELAKQAGDICDSGEKRLNGLDAPRDFETNPVAAGRFLGRFVPIADDTVSQLKDLKPPDELKDSYDAYLARQEKAVAAIRRAQQKAEKRDPSGLRDLRQVAADSDDLDALAKRAGVPRCAG